MESKEGLIARNINKKEKPNSEMLKKKQEIFQSQKENFYYFWIFLYIFTYYKKAAFISSDFKIPKTFGVTETFC